MLRTDTRLLEHPWNGGDLDVQAPYSRIVRIATRPTTSSGVLGLPARTRSELMWAYKRTVPSLDVIANGLPTLELAKRRTTGPRDVARPELTFGHRTPPA